MLAVCGGSNENCRFCGVLGTIPDELAALVTHAYRPEWAKAVGTNGCSAHWDLQTVGEDARKLKRANPGSRPLEIWMSSPAPGRAPRQSVPCPVPGCPARMLNPGKLKRHLNKVHSHGGAGLYDSGPSRPAKEISPNLHISAAAPNSLSSRVRGTSPRNTSTEKTLGAESAYAQCPICKVKVKATRISRHMRKVHRRVATRPLDTGNVPHSDKDLLRDGTKLVAPRDKNLDVTKPYAHAYRETGRYGSHPSHDGFDDESGPE